MMDDTATTVTPFPRNGKRARHNQRPLRLAVTAVLGALAVFVMVAFASFVRQVDVLSTPTILQTADIQADGIVVVTGGSQRIEAALQLLEGGVAERLLISGVHDQTQAEQLVARTSAEPALFECCVELDHAALDTLGNARETARWAQAHDLASLVVVTSAYHIPRTTREIARQLPGVELIAFPINPATQATARDDRRWPMSLLAREFVKLQLTRVRHLVGTLG